jgi:hypothetical protein
VAVGLFATTILVPAVFTLLQQGGVVTQLMWQFIDFFVSVFLAILWFGTISEALTQPAIQEHINPLLTSIVQVIFLYLLALFIAYLFSGNEFRLVTFASCGAHYIAFAGIAAGEHTQRHYFSDEVWLTFAFAGIACCLLAALFLAFYSCRSRLGEKYNHVINELELDIAGLVTSYLVTQAVRTALMGSYPAPHFLQQAAPAHVLLGNEHEIEHTLAQRCIMLGWAVFLVTLCITSVPKLQSWGAQGPVHRRLAHFCKVLLIMSGSWGFLLWGEWQFHAMFHGDQLFGKMVFAFLATAVCLGILWAIGLVVTEDDEDLLKAAKIGMTGLGLVAAWAWEHCFHVALDIIGEEYQVGYGGVVPKLVLAVVVPLFVLPVYTYYVKPKVLDIEEKEEEEEEDEIRRSPQKSTA